MGYEAACTIRIDGDNARGTAWLEHQDLVFRGPFRVVIPLKSITEARAQQGTLHVRFGDRRAALTIGSGADRWAARINNPLARSAKLGLKPGMQVALVNMTDADLEAELAALGIVPSTRVPRPATQDALFFGVDAPADLDRLASLAGAIVPAGAIWVIRRKGRDARVSERDTMAAGKRAGLVDVKVVSFSDTHTAEKFVIPVARRGATGRSLPSPRKRGPAPSRGRS